MDKNIESLHNNSVNSVKTQDNCLEIENNLIERSIRWKCMTREDITEFKKFK